MQAGIQKQETWVVLTGVSITDGLELQYVCISLMKTNKFVLQSSILQLQS